jgi:hypothetical protein
MCVCVWCFLYIYGKHYCIVGMVTILQVGQARVSVPIGMRDFSSLQNAQTSLGTSGGL